MFIQFIFYLSVVSRLPLHSRKKQYASLGSAFEVRARASQPNAVCSALSNACCVNEYFRFKFVVCSSSDLFFVFFYS